MEDITLTVVNYDADTDSVMTAKRMPALTGNGPDDLKCGGCGEVIGKGLTCDAIASSFQTERRLLLKCLCGAENLVQEAQSSTEAAS